MIGACLNRPSIVQQGLSLFLTLTEGQPVPDAENLFDPAERGYLPDGHLGTIRKMSRSREQGAARYNLREGV